MSTINAVGSSLPAYDVSEASLAPKQAPKPTSAQQVQDLEHSGKSAAEIATALGLPQTLVDLELGVTTASTDVTALASSLSIHV